MNRYLATVLLFCNAVAPANAQNLADEYYDPAEMANSRAALKASHGSQVATLIMAERLEFQSNGGDALTLWEAQGWVGGDIQKLWFKTEGDYATDEGDLEEAELQALYSRAISPFWDIQAGIRHDIKPSPSRTYAVVGAQGLAPYWFEVDGALFLSNKGDLSARLEVEYEIRLTQRAMLQPRIELNAAFSDDSEVGVGSGLATAVAGLRLRYEVAREFAPYVGVSWRHAFGDTADYQIAEGSDVHRFSWIAGVRFWF